MQVKYALQLAIFWRVLALHVLGLHHRSPFITAVHQLQGIVVIIRLLRVLPHLLRAQGLVFLYYYYE